MIALLLLATPDLDAGVLDANGGRSFGAWIHEGSPRLAGRNAETFVAGGRWFTNWVLACPVGTWCSWVHFDFPDGRSTLRPSWAEDRPWPTTFYSLGRAHSFARRSDADAGVHHPPTIEVSRRPPRRANGEWDLRTGLMRYGVVVAVEGTDYGWTWRALPPEPPWELYEWAVGPRPNEEQEEPEPVYGYPDVARARTCAVGWVWVRPFWASGEEHVYVACDPLDELLCEAPPKGLDRSAVYVLRRWWELRPGPTTKEPPPCNADASMVSRQLREILRGQTSAFGSAVAATFCKSMLARCELPLMRQCEAMLERRCEPEWVWAAPSFDCADWLELHWEVSRDE